MSQPRVVDRMLGAPIVLAASAPLDEARRVLSSSHVHMVLVTQTGRLGEPLLGTLVRDDLPPVDVPGGGPALDHSRLEGRTVDAGLDAETVRAAMHAAGERRHAVVDHGRLVGLLCLKRSGLGFCSDEGVAARRAARDGDA